MTSLQRLRRHNPGASIASILWYTFCRSVVWLIVMLLYRQRTWGLTNIPATGPVLVVCNHQSFLDLLATNSLVKRDLNFMARATLFKNRSFAGLIRSLNAFEVEQGKGDVGAIRKSIEILSAGRMLLVFPEGSRTRDGAVHKFQEGIMLLVRRAKPLVLPMAVEGPFDIWPIHRKARLSGRIGVSFGKPIASEALLAMPSKDAMELLRCQVEHLRYDLRLKLRTQTHGRFPRPGAGDTLACPDANP